jgi:hypothetical protein
MDGIKDGKITVSSDYSSEVLNRNRSPVHASLDWLKDNNVVSDEDIALFGRLTQRRNEISHALHTNLLNEALMGEMPSMFKELRGLLRKIEVWWIVNFDLSLTDDAPESVEETDIMPGPVMMLDLMIGVALGSEEEANSYLEGYLRMSSQ